MKSGQKQADRLRDYYGAWAERYGDPKDDGLFARVRNREMRIVHELLALVGTESILDAGCGSGVYARPLATRGHEVWAVDLCPEMVKRVAGHVHHAMVADLSSLALERLFDRILCLGVFEFVIDPASVFRRLRDHLSPGGRLIVLVPRTTIGGRIYQLLKARHGLAARLYAPAELRRLGEAAGLVYRSRCSPFFHNTVMVFECPTDRTIV